MNKLDATYYPLQEQNIGSTTPAKASRNFFRRRRRFFRLCASI
ncbi:hypothetical protein [Bernardetia sp.]|nr:hypothetical protein [Bernardetia sp.]